LDFIQHQSITNRLKPSGKTSFPNANTNSQRAEDALRRSIQARSKDRDRQ